MEIHDAIRSIRAVREYSPEEVPFDVVKEIVNAGRLAPSSRNSQPWRFLAIRERDNLQALSQMGIYAAHLQEASFCVAILTPDPEDNLSILFDAGQAAVFLQLAALEHGIGSCIVKLHEGYMGQAVFGYPDDYRLNYAIAFGYPKDGTMLLPFKKSRKPASELSFLESWGDSFE